MANNPHAETYQGKTQFSGPIKAGTRWNGDTSYDHQGTGSSFLPTVNVNTLANAGYVVCSQSAAVKQVGTGETITDIMLPPGTMILSIQFIVTTGYTGTDKDMALYLRPTSALAYITEYTSADRTDLSAVGVYNEGPSDGGGEFVWRNISDPVRISGAVPGQSSDVLVTNGNAGDGRAIVTVNYIPEFNYPLT